jgi:hypothetical protein
MPEMPISDSAARTSSSLKGLMMAVTSFIGTPAAAGLRQQLRFYGFAAD